MPSKTASTDKPPADKKQDGSDVNQALASHSDRIGKLEDRVDLLTSRLAASLGIDLSSGE